MQVIYNVIRKMKTLIAIFLIILVSGCAVGTTARNRITPGASINGAVFANDSVLPEVKIKITRFFEGECLFCMGSYIPIYEGLSDEDGTFEYRTQLGGTYELWVLPANKKFKPETRMIKNLTKTVYFKINLVGN